MTSTAEKLAARLEELPPGSMRRKIMETARRFKASWVELGGLLVQVKRESLWKEWGHPSFDAYCAKELFIRKQTAEKLTASWGFLERHEPDLLEARGGRDPKPVPSFEVIDVLSRAEAAGRLPRSGYQEIRDEIFERSPTPTAVNRTLTERFGPAPRPPPRDASERLGQLAAVARRLAEGCKSCEDVPRAVAERAAALADDLHELVAD